MADFLLDPQLYLYSRVKMPVIVGQNTIADKYTYTVTCATPNVTFYYTLNGTAPTTSSSVLTGSINVNHGTILKVLATRSGFRPSPIATDTALVTPRDPQITSTDHGVVTLTDTNINTQTGETVTMEYKKGADGAWTVYDSSNKPTFVHGDIIYSRSKRAGLYSPGTTSHTINIVIPAPTFSLTRTNDASGVLTISAEEGATIYYKVDSATTWATYTSAITVSQHQTVVAYCNKLNQDSATASIVTDFVPNKPTISINAVSGNVTLTDNCSTGYPATLYYQIDSTAGSWVKYTNSFTVNHGQVVYARAVREGLQSGDVSKTCEIEAIAAPVITISSDTGNTTIDCTTTLVKIYYTIDGSDPTTSSTEYTGTINALTHGAVVKAIAHKLGKSSSTASATVSITLVAPTITKSSEDVSTQTASVTLACATANSKIYYTTNGDTPTTSSTQYTSAFTVAHGTTVKAISVKLGRSLSASSTIYVTPKAPSIDISTTDGTVTIVNNNSSGTIQYWTSLDSTKKDYTTTFTVDYGTVVYATCTRNSLTSATAQATCDIALEAPIINYNQNTGEGTITCSTANSTVYFTTDDTDPKTGTIPAATEQFTHGMIVRAIAYKQGKWSAEATSVTVSINLANPVISISTTDAAKGTGSATITVSDTSGKDITIEYSLDNSTWKTYSSAVSVLYSDTIYARATKLNKTTTANLYAGSKITLAAPSVSINDSGVVIFSQTNTGASVYYTTNGSDPTTSSTKWTSGNITVNHGTVVKVIEYRGTLYSSIASATCNISLASAVISYKDNSVANQKALVTISCSTADSTIYYTTDGTTPSTSSAVYSNAFEVDHNTTIKAFTAKLGKTTTAVTAIAYVTPKAPSVSISSSDGTVTLTDNNNNESAEIYYTTDGKNPTTSSTKWTSGTFSVTHGVVVKVIAVRHSLTSAVSSATCSITLATPTISLSLLSSASGTMTATVNNTTSGASYYYEVGNSPADPTEGSTLYSSSSKPSVYHGGYIKVRGYKLGNTTTVVTSAQASVIPVAPTLTATLADVVTMSHSNTDVENITIRYTKGDNGADPADPTATTGTVYSGAITSTENTRFDAITVRTNNGLTVVSSTGTVTVPSTTYSITKTAENVSTQTGTYKLSSSLAVDRIYYTTDGITPTASSSYVSNNGTITNVACDTVIKIKGYLNGVLDDEVFSVTAYITPKAPSVTWRSLYNNEFTVRDTNAGADSAAIYVTIDGTTPSASNTTDIRTISSAQGTVKAVAVRHGLTSVVTTSSHTITLSTPTVTWSARPATSGGGQIATVTCSNVKGATFYYTTDGTTPTTSSSSRIAETTANSITIDFGTAGTYTLCIYAVKKDYLDSAKLTDSKRTIYKLATPTITKTAKAGGYTVTFSCNKDTAGNSVSGIAIHYKNGSDVSVSDASLSHGGTVSCTPSVQTSYTYRAIATKDNYVNSDKATALSFTIYKLQAPVWGSFTNIENGKSIKITAYSAYVNGSNNTAVSGVTTTYTAPTSTETISGAGSATKNWTGTAYPDGKTLTATSSLDGYISSSATTTLTLYKLSTPMIGSPANATPGKSVTLTCSTYITSSGTSAVSNVKCHYTTDGATTPTSRNSSVVSGSAVTLTSAGTYTFKAIGILAGYVSSSVATGTQFSITQLDPPSIAKTAVVGGYNITYTSSNGLTLMYSINGGSSYSSQVIGSTGKWEQTNIRPSAQTTYNVWAYNRAAGYADSTVAKLSQFVIYKLTTPTVGNAEAVTGGKRVLLTCTTDTAGNTVANVDCHYSTGTATTSSTSVKSGSYVTYTPIAQTTYTVTCLATLAGYITSDLATGTAFTIYKLSVPTVSSEEAIIAGKQVKFTCTSDTAGNTVSGVTINVTSSPTTAVSATSVTSGNYVTYKPTAQTTYSITAVSMKSGYINSDSSTAKSLTVYKLSTPTISSADIVGGKRLTFSCNTDTAGNSVSSITIRYANGTPTASTSSTVSHGGIVDITTAGSFGYRAIATKNGYADSAVSDATSFKLYKLSKPTAAISDVVNGKNLTWTNATTYINGSSTSAVSGVTMVYQSGTSGTATSTTTSATATVAFTGAIYNGVTRTAYCQKSGYVTSDTTTSGAITVKQLSVPTISDPVDYVGGKKVTLSCTTDTDNGAVSGVTFRYTTNGTAPSTSSSSANPVDLNSAGTFTTWAMATKNGYMHSAVSKDSAITVYKLELTYSSSSINNASGVGSVTVVSKANGSNVNATVYYASTSSGTASASTGSSSATGSYTWTNQLHGNSFSALAQLSGYVSSDRKGYQLNITTVAPTIAFTQPDNNKTVTATITSNNSDNATKIYYSFTGTASASSTRYTSAITDFSSDPSAVTYIYACTARTANSLTSTPTTTKAAFNPVIIGEPGSWMLAATDTSSVIGSLT